MIGRHAPVLLIADHKWRDLPGLALLKVVLEDEHGIPTEIVNYQLWPGALVTFRPSVVCPTTMTGPREQQIARVARRCGAVTVVLPTEGLPSEEAVMPILGCRHVDLSAVDLWLTWNDVVRDYMIEAGSLTGDRVHTTGMNRFDFYVPPMRELLMNRVELDRRYGLMPGRPIVLWATNFAHASHATVRTDFMVRDWERRGLTKFDRFSDPPGYARADARAQAVALRMMSDVVRRFPAVNFVLKTHPSERPDVYRVFVDECRRMGASNLVLVNQQYIGDLLHNASVHLHRYCTTGMEAWMMDVPTLNFQFDDWHMHTELGGACGEASAMDHMVRTADDVSDGIAAYLDGQRPASAVLGARARHLRRWFHAVDGGSARRQAAAIVAAGERLGARRAARFTGLSGHGIRQAGQMCMNRALGRPFDAPLWGRGGDALGYVDRTVRQNDVAHWCALIRERRDVAAVERCASG